MKFVYEMQFMQYFGYWTVLSPPCCCKLLLEDVKRIFVAFPDDESCETDFLVIILNFIKPSLEGQKFIIIQTHLNSLEQYSNASVIWPG